MQPIESRYQTKNNARGQYVRLRNQMGNDIGFRSKENLISTSVLHNPYWSTVLLSNGPSLQKCLKAAKNVNQNGDLSATVRHADNALRTQNTLNV